MQTSKLYRICLILVGLLVTASAYPANGETIAVTTRQTSAKPDYYAARRDPIHFKPAIKTATNEQCLACHQEILQRTVLEKSPAGVLAADSLAWYQTLSTYTGDQDTFHRRHLVDDYARQVMDLKCNTCHEGNDPRDEESGSSATAAPGLTMRKMADPYVCALCHSQYNYQRMGVPGPWYEHSQTFNNSCLTCHAGIKTERHQGVTFLKAAAIETAAKADTNVCYGCHGGRAWYRSYFPYSEKRWPGWSDVPPGLEGKYSRTGMAATAAPAASGTAATPATATQQAGSLSGEEGYKKICFGCHDTGVAESPRLGDKAAWAPRIAQGREAMFNTVITGKGAMPPRGGSTLSDDEIKAVIDYMISKAQ